MPDGLYETDVLIWAEQQADLLRRLAAGERVNDAVDWPHVIEELQDVGLSELTACRSLLRQALVHLLKVDREPESPAVPHWRDEIAAFLADAESRLLPSMRQRIDLEDLFAKANRQLATASGAQRPAFEPCPFTLADLLSDSPDLDALLSALAASGGERDPDQRL